MYNEKGKKVGIFLPIKKYETMKKHLEHMEDIEDALDAIIDLREHGKDDMIKIDEAKKLLDAL